MNKKFSLILVGIIVAVAIAAITITVTENISVKAADIATPPPQEWVLCAIEGKMCKPPGVFPTVKFGHGTSWITLTQMGNPTPCTIQQFTYDPAPGQTKECYYKAYVSTPPGPWVKCATQDGICKFSNVVEDGKLVKYGGANGNWIYGTYYYEKVDCNKATFGDPDYGHDKNCYYQGTTPTGPWAQCATQGGNCIFTEKTMLVKYGGDNHDWVYGTFNGTAPCNKAQFGDPDYGHDKNCFYRDNVPNGPWTKCATEGDICVAPQSTAPTIYVKYGGSNNNWVYGIFMDSIICDNAQFGDPDVGNNKNCFTSTLGH